jgi:hypothetical protein
MGRWPVSLAAIAIAGGLLLAAVRRKGTAPLRSNAAHPLSSVVQSLTKALSSTYRSLGRMTEAVGATLEGAGGVMWSLLFLVLLASLLVQASP